MNLKVALAIAALVIAGLATVWIAGIRVLEGTLSAGSFGAGQNTFTIGTGPVTGVYYPAGGAICRLVNKARDNHGVRCVAESTAGSVFNLNAIRNSEMELGVVQSDWQFHALNGSASFKPAGPFPELRSLFSIHSEGFTVLVRRNAKIKTMKDLKGKRVNIGSPGSGLRATMEVVMEAYGWTTKDFSAATEFKPVDQMQALCNNKVDATIYVVGHPNGAIQEATVACDTMILEVAGPEIDKLIAENSFYAPTVIPGGLYDRNADDIRTFGVKATLVSSAAMSADVVYEIVKAVFDNFEEFRNQHPAFTYLDPKQLPLSGNSAPLHPGAERYFQEKGML